MPRVFKALLQAIRLRRKMVGFSMVQHEIDRRKAVILLQKNQMI